jgi:hypothetical protein
MPAGKLKTLDAAAADLYEVTQDRHDRAHPAGL